MKTMKKLFRKELLKVGSIRHPKAKNQVIDIDKTFLEKLVENFKTSPFAPVIRGHNEAEAERDPSLIVSQNTKNLAVEGDSLYGDIEMDEKELDKYNDVSVGLKLDAFNKKTGKSIGPALRHVAMTLRPFVGGLEPFVALSDTDLLTINLSDINMDKKEEVVEVVEPVEEVVEPVIEEVKEEVETEEEVETVEPEKVETEEAKPEEEAELSEVEQLKAEIVTRDAEIVSLNAEKVVLTSVNRVKEAEVEFSNLLRAGKVLPVQKDAFISIYSAPEIMVEFSDSEEKIGLTEAMKKFTESMPKIINLSEDGAVIDEEEVESRPHYAEYRASKPEMNDEEYDKHYEANKVFIAEEMAKA